MTLRYDVSHELALERCEPGLAIRTKSAVGDGAERYVQSRLKWSNVLCGRETHLGIDGGDLHLGGVSSLDLPDGEPDAAQPIWRADLSMRASVGPASHQAVPGMAISHQVT